jgi:hypothetical protein
MARTSSYSPFGLPLALMLAVGVASGSAAAEPAAAAVEPAAAELRIPPAPPEHAQKQLAATLAVIDPAMHQALHAVAADATERLLKNARDVAAGKGKRLSVREACRAALLAADFAGFSQLRWRLRRALVDVAVVQLELDLHRRIRASVERELAIRSVRACASDIACVDAIRPTDAMPAAAIAAARDGKVGAAAGEIGNISLERELGELGTIYSQVRSTRSQAEKRLEDHRNELRRNWAA